MACTECATGSLHEGTPIGRVETLHGIPAYITDPPNGIPAKGIVVIVPDAFGWTFNNNRILADAYAKRASVTVYLPEFMDGHHIDASVLTHMDTVGNKNVGILGKILPGFRAAAGFIPFLYQNRLSITQPRVFSFFTALRTSTTLPIAAAGFCWGGKFVALLCHDSSKTPDGRSLINCGFTAHPSNLQLPGDMEKVVLPLSISQGTEDFVLNMAGVKVIQEIFKGKEENLGSGEKGRFEIVVVQGAKHGFAVRGNPGAQEEVKQGLQAEDQAVAWFERWLGENGVGKA